MTEIQTYEPEQGDVCVTHGSTFEGAYGDDATGSWPICDEVDGGFAPEGDCRFVPADSTDEARMNTPADEMAEEARLYRVQHEAPSAHETEIVTSLEDSTGELRSFLRCSCGVETDYMVHKS